MDAQTKAMQRIAKHLGTDYMGLVDGLEDISLEDLSALNMAIAARMQKLATSTK